MADSRISSGEEVQEVPPAPGARSRCPPEGLEAPSRGSIWTIRLMWKGQRRRITKRSGLSDPLSTYFEREQLPPLLSANQELRNQTHFRFIQTLTHTTILSHKQYHSLTHTTIFSCINNYTLSHTILSYIPNYILSPTLLYSLIYNTILSHTRLYSLIHACKRSIIVTTRNGNQ